MKKLFHVRHGLSEMNKLDKVSSVTDTPLAPEGKEQAKKAGVLAKEYDINIIVSSPLVRAHDTAKIIAEYAGVPTEKVLVNNLLTERDYGVLEGTHYPRLKKINAEKYEGVEAWSELRDRAKKAIDWIKTLEGDNILIVSHGSMGRALRQVVKPDVSVHLKLGNAEIERWL